MDLGQKLRDLRKQFRLTLSDVGERIDLSISFLSDIERGRTRPSLETLESLAKVYQTTAAKLLEESGDDTDKAPKGIPGLDAFTKKNKVDPDVLQLMLQVDRRSKRKAESEEDWRRVYYSLQSLLQ